MNEHIAQRSRALITTKQVLTPLPVLDWTVWTEEYPDYLVLLLLLYTDQLKVADL